MKRFLITMMVGVCLGMMLPGLTACPNPETGKIDPYLTARTIILQANTALGLADGIFGQWYLGKMLTDQDIANKTKLIYEKTKTGVANGLQIALNGVAIAEQAKKDPNIQLLMGEADKAWQNLRKFLTDLLAKQEDAKLVTLADAPKKEPPTSAPVTKDDPKAPPKVAVKTSAITVKVDALKNLPKTLLP